MSRGVPSTEADKQVVRDMIADVWTRGDLDALPRYWSEDCVNHADPAGEPGLTALRRYHDTFVEQLAGLSDLRIEVVAQIAEAEHVVTHLLAHARHTGDVDGLPATGRRVTLQSMRIDRLRRDKIVEHWSVADVAGLLRQCGAAPASAQRSP